MRLSVSELRKSVEVYKVPGAFEIPLLALRLQDQESLTRSFVLAQLSGDKLHTSTTSQMKWPGASLERRVCKQEFQWCLG